MKDEHVKSAVQNMAEDVPGSTEDGSVKVKVPK